MFDIRLLLEEDYDQLKGWWEDWKWSAPTREMLPDNGKCGLMVSKNGTNICAGFLYFTNSTLAQFEFIISNMNYREKDRKEALNTLIDAISMFAQQQGFKQIFTSLNNKHLLARFLDCDYIVGDKKVTQLIKKL